MYFTFNENTEVYDVTSINILRHRIITNLRRLDWKLIPWKASFMKAQNLDGNLPYSVVCGLTWNSVRNKTIKNNLFTIFDRYVRFIKVFKKCRKKKRIIYHCVLRVKYITMYYWVYNFNVGIFLCSSNINNC